MAGFPVVMGRVYWAWALAERGEFDRGVDLGHEAVRLAEALNHPYSLTLACHSLGHLYEVKGDLRHARPWLERSVALSREWNLNLVASIVTEMLGYVCALSGRLPEGLELLQHALTTMESTKSVMFLALLLVHLGEAHAFANQPAEALSLAERALTLARDCGHRSSEAWALRLVGEITSNLDSPETETAEDHYRKALALADELGMRPLVAHCHLGLGKLYRRMGTPEPAREHLNAAHNPVPRDGYALLGGAR